MSEIRDVSSIQSYTFEHAKGYDPKETISPEPLKISVKSLETLKGGFECKARSEENEKMQVLIKSIFSKENVDAEKILGSCCCCCLCCCCCSK